MIKRPFNCFITPTMFIICSDVFASPDALFTVTGTGGQGPLDIILCLNGKAGISCQQFSVAGGYNLTITPTIPNHSYPAVGLEILTPGVIISNCPQYAGNRCLFASIVAGFMKALLALLVVSLVGIPLAVYLEKTGHRHRLFSSVNKEPTPTSRAIQQFSKKVTKQLKNPPSEVDNAHHKGPRKI